ncbi:Tetratricopeptide repeat-containing protein, partial [Desulfomicrobium apsheronum]
MGADTELNPSMERLSAKICGYKGVVANLINKGQCYYKQGDYAQAESHYKCSLAILEEALGPDHPDVARSLYHLGLLYKTQRDYSQAEPFFKRSLAIREKALGPDHPDVA